MKILTTGKTFFELPDDFSGTVSDALRLMADYIDTPTKQMTEPKEDQPTFDEFLHTLEEGGKLLTKISVQYLNKETNKWEKQPQGAKWK